MAFNEGNSPASVNSLEVVISNFEHLQAGAENVLLPEIRWTSIIPMESVDTSVNPGARMASYLVRDRRGRGAFRGRESKNIPSVGTTLDKVTVPIESAGVTAHFDRADARAVLMGNETNLMTDLGEVMREASERHIEKTVFYGFAALGYQGILSYPGVPVTTAALKDGSHTAWTYATNDQIVFDIQNAIASVFTTTKGVFLPDTIALPPLQFALLTAMKVSNAGNVSVMEYLATNNVYTQQTGQRLNFVHLRYLQGAGSGNTDRMMVYTKNPKCFWMPMPLPFEMLEPQQRGFGVDLLAEYVFGSFHMKQPLSAQYVDGV